MNPEIQITRLNFIHSVTSLSLFLTELKSVIQISDTSAKKNPHVLLWFPILTAYHDLVLCLLYSSQDTN
jgi:hypothetical protein